MAGTKKTKSVYQKELKQLEDRFKVLWEAENCKMEEMEFKDY